jgi:uncharacterized protein
MKTFGFPGLILFIIAALAGFGFLRLEIDTDIVRSLPSGERVLSDALEIFENHPIHDQIAIDVSKEKGDRDTLVEIALLLEEGMEKSGLFAEVGSGNIGELIPDVADHIAGNLPILFSENDLQTQVAPLLTDANIEKRFQQMVKELSSMDGIGKAHFMGKDPLDLRNLVLARMASLAPSLEAGFYRGRLFSADGRHILVTAKPRGSGTDTVSAAQIDELFDRLFSEVKSKYSKSGQELTLTPVGGYRAALDNERIIRHDVQLALILVTLGIGVLLIFSFPRPLMGLLSLLPALAGTSTALFVFSLFHDSLSIMVLGFGGAVVSITVDHGVGYLLFLDRTHKTKGREAAHEIRAIGIMAVITSIGAFLILSCSGFPIFLQLGQFTALGIFFSFLFVHTIFPRMFATMPAGNPRNLPVRELVDALYGLGKPGAIAAALLALVLLFFAKPEFHVSLSSMNTVSKETIEADALFTEVWGSVGQRIFIMNEGRTVEELQNLNDTLLERVEGDLIQESIASGFNGSQIFPGKERSHQNLSAWRSFWSEERREKLKESFKEKGTERGFAVGAFTDFLTLLDPETLIAEQEIPSKYFPLFGISENQKGDGLIQFTTLVPGDHYDGAKFSERYSEIGKVFDANYFTTRLADLLFSTFVSILAVIAVSVLILVFVFSLDVRLTFFTLLPPLFAYICTLGTLKLMGRPLDIPSLMLSVVILGMGIDYSIFCVRAHQRYRRIEHPSYSLVRVAIFIAGVSTLIGFGVLAIAEHSLLKSIGITSLLGIGYSLSGTFLLLPPLLTHYFKKKERKGENRKGTLLQRVGARYRTLEPYPRMFAHSKLRVDPLFSDIATILSDIKEPGRIVDIGCGYGVPACYLLEKFSKTEVVGIDPDPERIRVATIAAGKRGSFSLGMAPQFVPLPGPADVVLLLDMFHYLNDDLALATLKKAEEILVKDGRLVMRYVIRPDKKPSWSWHLEDKRIRLTGGTAWYRSPETMAEMMVNAGFRVEKNEVTTSNPELYWMVGCA